MFEIEFDIAIDFEIDIENVRNTRYIETTAIQ
jgi:hypothetical protein